MSVEEAFRQLCIVYWNKMPIDYRTIGKHRTYRSRFLNNRRNKPSEEAMVGMLEEAGFVVIERSVMPPRIKL